MSVQNEITRLENAKASIKAAIEGKGVTVPDTTRLDGMAPLIDSIGAGAEVYYIDLTGNYPNYTCTTPMADIAAAYTAGRELKCRCSMGSRYTAVLPLFVPIPSVNTWVFSGSGALDAMQFLAQSLTIAISNGEVVAQNTPLATTDDIQMYLPKSVSVTLAAASWDSTAKTQTVTVTGVSAIEKAQMVIPTPALASQTAYYEAGILCTGQAANSLTFTCKTVPTGDLTVYVVIQEVIQEVAQEVAQV